MDLKRTHFLLCYIFNKAKHAGNYFSSNSRISFLSGLFSFLFFLFFTRAAARLSFCTFHFTHYREHTRSEAGQNAWPFCRGAFVAVSDVVLDGGFLHTWNSWRGFGSAAEVFMICLLSRSDYRLSVKSKHLQLRDRPRKVALEKIKDSIRHKSHPMRLFKTNSITLPGTIFSSSNKRLCFVFKL